MRLKIASACVFLVIVCRQGLGERITLEKPVRITAQKYDKTALTGRVSAYDDDGFDLLDTKDHVQTIVWNAVDTRSFFQVHAQLIGNKDATPWVTLGRDLLKRSDGKEWAEKAFDRALRIDPASKELIQAARLDAASAAKSEVGPQPAGGDPARGIAAGMGPSVTGSVFEKYWGLQSEDAQADAVVKLKAFAEGAAKKLNSPLALQETKYFLFYSDLPHTEAANWAGLLDRMYVRLASLFGVEKGENIWRGKGLILVFKSAADYRRFESEVHQTAPGETAGMCHCFGDGMVHIAFYRQPRELTFAHILVHESVHGFIHRYRSPVSIPSWPNEGLAEAIASELVPDPERGNPDVVARLELMSNGNNLLDFFTEAHIVGWQYPVAQSLCSFMIRSSKTNYVNFINGIKDGMSVQDSLEQKYKAPLDRLLAAYGSSLNINNIKAYGFDLRHLPTATK